MTELDASVLRFWESVFSQLRPKKSRTGNRMYREKDIKLIQEIKRLTRDEGYTIAGAKKQLQEAWHKSPPEAPEMEAPGQEPIDSDLRYYLQNELMAIRTLLSS
jgi:DNA-binding transcriptional MerR regulator